MFAHMHGKKGCFMPTGRGEESALHMRRTSLYVSALLSLTLLLFLSACGAGGTGGNSGTGSNGNGSSDGTTKTVKGFGSSHGCPTDAVIEKRGSNPAVTIKPAQQDSTVQAHKGDVIEVQLPFGSRWTGPTKSQGPLQLDLTPGFADQSAKTCVWRFTALGTGKTELGFSKQPLCTGKERVCAMYIIRYDFTINVQ